MANIGNEIDAILAANIGEEVRGKIAGALEKMNAETNNAQKWAEGKDGAADVPDTDPAYHNNAKYYAGQAAASAATLTLDATLESATKAAQAKAVGDKFAPFEKLLKSSTVLTDEYIENQYINTNQTIGTEIATSGTSTPSYNYIRVACSAGDQFILFGRGGTNPRLWAFVDENNLLKSVVSGKPSPTESDPLVLTAEYDGYFISNVARATQYGLTANQYKIPSDPGAVRFDSEQALSDAQKNIAKTNIGLNVLESEVTELSGDVENLETDVSTLEARMNGEYAVHDYTLAGGGTGREYGLFLQSKLEAGVNIFEPDKGYSKNSNGQFTIIEIQSYQRGGIMVLESPQIAANSSACFGFADANMAYIVGTSRVTSGSKGLVYDEDSETYISDEIPIPDGAAYLFYSVYSGSSLSLTVKIREVESDISSIRYVSPGGSDNNNGLTTSMPMLTVDAAIASGAKIISVAGGVYRQTINLASVKDRIRFVPTEKDKLPLFINPNALLGESETAVSGYENVYSTPCDVAFGANELQIFQDGVPDADTEIEAGERHPLQRGKPYRCDDTVIWKADADNLSDALAEIEAASGYKWYIDTANETLYYSRPQAVSSTHPLMRCGVGFTLFTGNSRQIALEMIGIVVKYQHIDLRNLAGAILTDCSCGNVNGAGAFMWDYSVGVRLYRCEAYRVSNTTSTGDGFNAHSSNTGDAFAKQTTSFLIDCWAHDIQDDGYSDHERCEISIFGGLFEYNGSGVTPAVGSHCTCYNVYSRFNKREADFYYTGEPAVSEGGVGGQFACFGCVSEGKGSGQGFRLSGDAETVFGLFVNCIVINRDKGFNTERLATGRLINCSTYGVNTPKSSRYTVVNGKLIDLPPTSGTTAGRPTGVDAGFLYYDTTLGRAIIWDGTLWVDAAAIYPRSGTDENRPTGVDVGFLYYDTELGKLIVWNGTAWVNADGTALS